MAHHRSIAALLLLAVPVVPCRADDPPGPTWAETSRAVDDALSAADVESLEQALVGLARFPGEPSVSRILESLPSGEALGIYGEEHKQAIVQALLEASAGSGPGLAELVERARRDPDLRIRLVAIDVLSLRPEREPRLIVIGLLDDAEEKVAMHASHTVAERRWPEAVEPLLAALERAIGARDEGRAGAARAALRCVTGETFRGVAAGRAWWKRHGSGFVPPAPAIDARFRVLARLERRRPEDLELLEAIPAGAVLSLDGTALPWQLESGRGLSATPAGYSPLDPAAAKFSIDRGTSIVLLGSELVEELEAGQGLDEGSQDLVEGRLVDALRVFVQRGGSLCSEGRGIEFLARLFPRQLQIEGAGQVGRVEIAPGDDHPLLRDAFPINPLERAGAWWAVETSPSVRFSRGVASLVVERRSATPLSFAFRPSRTSGWVVHRGGGDPGSTTGEDVDAQIVANLLIEVRRSGRRR